MSGPAVEAAKIEMYRSVIAEAAEQIFAEQGYGEAKVSDIAARAGVSLGTLYKVFNGKAEILAAVHGRRSEAIYAATTSALGETDSCYELMLHGVGGYIRHQAGAPNYLLMLLREGYAWSESTGLAHAEQREVWERGMELAASVFSEGIRNGEFVDGPPRRHARLLIVVVQAMLADWVERDMEDPVDDLVRDVLDGLVRALCTDAIRQRHFGGAA